MEKDVPFRNLLGIFAHYGFRKASMEDLARAANVSRQTLYKRFKTKDTVLDWAVEGFVRENRERASAELENHDASLADRLLNAFCRWTGDHAALLHEAPHGAEIMEMGIDSLMRSDADPEAAFENEVAKCLKRHGACKTRKEAADKTYLLLMSAKGLLLKSPNGEAFRAGMSRILRAAI